MYRTPNVVLFTLRGYFLKSFLNIPRLYGGGEFN